MVTILTSLLLLFISILILTTLMYVKSNSAEQKNKKNQEQSNNSTVQLEPLMYFGPEQRQRVRVNLRDQPCDTEFLESDSSQLNKLKHKKFKGTIENISTGGLKFSCTYGLPVQQNIILDFSFKLKNEKFNLQGEVIKKEEFNNHETYSYGIRFINMPVQSEKRLTQIINQIIMEHRKKTS